MLTVFAVYLILGNLPRIIPTLYSTTYFSFTEALLYFVSLLFLWKFRHKIGRLWVLPLGLAFSTSYGIFLYGFQPFCVLYGLKLILMVVAGWSLGQRLYDRFGADLRSMARFVVRLYSCQLLVGFALFFLFPNAADLFAFLEGEGLVFKGDPHRFRFVSSCLDPNYASALACIPLLLLRHVGDEQRVWKFLFLVSIVLSFSRSGLATFGLLFLALHWKNLRLGKTLLVILLTTIALALCFPEPLRHFVQRLFALFEDESALCRWSSFQTGLAYFSSAPLFGMGYHFLSQTLADGSKLSSLDSSVLQTLVDFGLVPTLCLLVCFVVWALNRFALYAGNLCEKLFCDLFYYVLIVLVFSSLFNNIIYYTFWLIPVVALFTYVYENRTCS